MDYSLKGCKELGGTKQALSTGHNQGRGRGGVELLLKALLYFYIRLLSPEHQHVIQIKLFLIQEYCVDFCFFVCLFFKFHFSASKEMMCFLLFCCKCTFQL